MTSGQPGASDLTGGNLPAAREPKYFRLKQYLLEITQSAPPGSPVPAERMLAQQFDTTRTTVRQAIQDLVVEGRLTRHQGRGTFVARPKVAQRLQLTSFTQDIRDQGLEPGSRFLSIRTERADQEVAELLGIRPGGRVLVIERLRTASDTPMAVERAYLSAARFPGLRQRLLKRGSLYEVLREDYGVEPAEAEEVIETGVPSPQDALLLESDLGVPVLLLSRHTFDENGVPFEWVRSLYRGDRYKFVARLTRD